MAITGTDNVEAASPQARAERAAWWSSLSRHRQALLTVAGAFLVTRLMVAFIIFISALLLPLNPHPGLALPPAAFPHNPVLDGLVRWDSQWYERIVTQGYSAKDVDYVFFPAYPLIVKALTFVIHNSYLAGLLVSNAALFVALCYLYALARREFDDATAGRAVFYYAAAPAAVFLSAMYTESLFAAAVAATFYYAREGRWAPAAVAGALGAATRNTGALLVAVILLEGMSRQGVRLTPPAWRPRAALAHLRRQVIPALAYRPSVLSAAGALLGLLAYMAYLGVAFGDPLAFVHGQAHWQGVSVQDVLRIMLRTVHGATAAGSAASHAAASTVQPAGYTGLHSGYLILDVLSIADFVPIVAGVALKMRPAYGVYTVLTFALPILVGHGVLSAIRFTLMLLPCFLLLGVWGRRPLLDRLVLGLSLPLMAYLAITFSHWYPPF